MKSIKSGDEEFCRRNCMRTPSDEGSLSFCQTRWHWTLSTSSSSLQTSSLNGLISRNFSTRHLLKTLSYETFTQNTFLYETFTQLKGRLRLEQEKWVPTVTPPNWLKYYVQLMSIIVRCGIVSLLLSDFGIVYDGTNSKFVLPSTSSVQYRNLPTLRGCLFSTFFGAEFFHLHVDLERGFWLDFLEKYACNSQSSLFELWECPSDIHSKHFFCLEKSFYSLY